jgi:glycosyltransferase involved in cell wall biosynthesis
MSSPPLLSYVTFNRLGLTVKNLASIFDTTDDFEMHIIDNNSSDGTWDYIQSLDDERIISKTRIGVNVGLIYALNINLMKRRPDQYFISVDNDVYIETKDWITRFLKVFKKFPDVGLLGVEKGYPDPNALPPAIHKRKGGVSYYQIKNTRPDAMRNYVPGCCMCLSPKLIEETGYLSEENYFGDIELCYRINNYTDFKTGFVKNISIKMPQAIKCGECKYKNRCELYNSGQTCFTNYRRLYKNDDFKRNFRWKLYETIADLDNGTRPVYCASSHDYASMSSHIFNMEWALENFRFYIENAN